MASQFPTRISKKCQSSCYSPRDPAVSKKYIYIYIKKEQRFFFLFYVGFTENGPAPTPLVRFRIWRHQNVQNWITNISIINLSILEQLGRATFSKNWKNGFVWGKTLPPAPPSTLKKISNDQSCWQANSLQEYQKIITLAITAPEK